MLRTFIQFTSVMVTFLASLFWLRAAVLLTYKDIAALSGRFLGYNKTSLAGWAAQKTDSLIAGGLLSISFVLQIVNGLLPMSFDDFGIDKIGVIFSLILTIILGLLCSWLSKYIKNHFITKVHSFLSESEKMGALFTDPDRPN